MARRREHRFAQRAAWTANARRLGLSWRLTAHYLLWGVALAILVAWLPHVPMREVLVGLVVGLWMGMLAISVAGFDDPLVRGDLAEQWTAEAFDSVRGWRVTNGLRFHDGDLDHVVVTPSGVVAVESKYRYRQTDRAKLSAQRWHDLEAAARAGRKARSLLLSKEVDHVVPVSAALVIWGKGSPNLAAGFTRVDDVYVLDGEHPGLWSHLFNAPVVAPSVQAEIARALDRFQRGQAAHQETHEASRLRVCWREFRIGVREERLERAKKKAQKKSMRRRHATGAGRRHTAFAAAMVAATPSGD